MTALPLKGRVCGSPGRRRGLGPALLIATLVCAGCAEPRKYQPPMDTATLDDTLERLPGVAAVRLVGARERQVVVEVDPDLLRAYGLTTADLSRALHQATAAQPMMPLPSWIWATCRRSRKFSFCSFMRSRKRATAVSICSMHSMRFSRLGSV